MQVHSKIKDSKSKIKLEIHKTRDEFNLLKCLDDSEAYNKITKCGIPEIIGPHPPFLTVTPEMKIKKAQKVNGLLFRHRTFFNAIIVDIHSIKFFYRINDSPCLGIRELQGVITFVIVTVNCNYN